MIGIIAYIINICYIITENRMNTTSFQTNHYNYAHQANIQGTSGLKIFAGEDLSNYDVTQHLEIGADSNKCSPITGGDSKWNKRRGEKTWTKCRKTISIARHSKPTNTVANLNNKKRRG